MLKPAYRVRTPMMAVMRLGAKEALRSLNSGAVVLPLSDVNAAGMVEAMCNGRLVTVFERDLFERSEPIEIDPSPGLTNV